MVHKRLHWILPLVTWLSVCPAGVQVGFAQAVKSAQVSIFRTTSATIAADSSTRQGLESGRSGQSLGGSSEPWRVELQSTRRSLEGTAGDARGGNQVSEPWRNQLREEPPAAAQLSGHQVACQAACCFPLAKLLEQRAATLLADAEGCGSGQESVAQLQACFLRKQAAWQRDVAAATALRAYYSWIANRQQLMIVDECLQFQRQQVDVQNALIAKGIAITDATALERHRLELLDKQVQLQAADQQLASGVLRLTCCQSDLHTTMVEGLDIQPGEIDCESLRSFALEHRPDYLALIQLCQCLTDETVRGVAGALTPLVGVGLNAQACNWIEKLAMSIHGDQLLSQVRAELRLAIQALRTRIEQDVCDKCSALRTAYQRVTIAEEIIASWNQRIAALERLEQLGDARGAQLSVAQGELLTARSTLVTRKLAAKLAEVDLAEAVGQLSQRCCQGQPWLVRP